ncbi:MAG: peptidyl-alpha-hydroxyglycine alpha-amidating lyase family protein [Lautropia sp.]
MATVVGEGEYRYRVVEGWGMLPDGWDYKEVGGVAVDSKDNVYVFNRGEHPMIVFDRDGNFLRSWGEGMFPRAHGIHIDEHDHLYLTDDLSHTVRKCTPEGKVLLEIGTHGKPAGYMSGQPFHRCTHTALAPTGDIYVSDGYGNARVHKYSPDGKLLSSWGEPGTGPGEFNIVHTIVTDADGWVYVADRENHRIQVFDGNGRYQTQWHNLHRPCGLYCCRGPRPRFLVGELGPFQSLNIRHPNIGPRLSVLDDEGSVVARIGDPAGASVKPGSFIAPHGVAMDSRGDIYIGEVSYTAWPQVFPGIERPKTVRSLQKYARVAGTEAAGRH